VARYIIVVVALATAISLLAQQISSIRKPHPNLFKFQSPRLCDLDRAWHGRVLAAEVGGIIY